MDPFDSMPMTIASNTKTACSGSLIFQDLPAALFIAMLITSMICSAESDFLNVQSKAIPTLGYEVINAYPHDSRAFTQGLVYDGNELLFEGTGLNGQSSLRLVNLQNGSVLKKTNLDSELFGEGVTLLEDRIVQLTWKSGLGLVYNKENFTKIGNFSYSTEGWGITSDNNSLIMSDGSNVLHILDPESFAEMGQIWVTANGLPLTGLNELEYVKGEIYANVWPTYWIAIISPKTGEVTARVNLMGILKANETEGKSVDVLNGIAYDASEDRLFVTGKLWPRLYEIRLVRPSN